MRWPFSKKHRELTIPPDEEQLWSVAQGETEGGLLLVRYNESAGELAGHPGLPIKLGFALPLNHPDKGGLPDAEENGQLLAIEDVILGQVLSATTGIHALTLTTGLMKEFVFYIAPGADIAKLHADLREAVTSHDVQCIAVEEPGWDTYRDFTP